MKKAIIIIGLVASAHLSFAQWIQGPFGIGTDSPDYTLDVEGTVNADTILLNGLPLVRGGGFWTPNGSDIHYNVGNVGIGTTNPGAGLHMYADRYTLYGPNSTWGQYLQVGGNGRVTTHASVTATNGNLHLDSKNGGFSTSINYYSRGNTYLNARGGNVGIGTTSPQSKLAIQGDGSTVGSASINFKHAGHGMSIGLSTATNNLVIGNSWNPESGTYMTIQDGTGNVGIGTTNPSNDQGWNNVLDLRGWNNAKLLVTTDSAKYKTGVFSHKSAYGGGGFIGTESSHNLHLITGYNPRLSVLTNGNVGIGTTSPAQKLQVNGNAIIGQPGETLKIGNIGWNDWAGIAHANRANRTDYALIQDSNGQTILNSKADQLLRFRQGNVDKMVINNGNLGIGTTSPVRKLQVGDNSTDFSAFGRFDGSWSTDYKRHGRVEFNDANFGIGAGKITSDSPLDDDLYLWSYGGAGRDIRFMSTLNGNTDPSTWRQNMIIKGNTGNVGIGTINPAQKLQVNGNAIIGQPGETLKIGNIGWNDWAGIAHANRANQTDYALIQDSNGQTILNSKADQLLRFRQGNSTKMVINNGKVGIGNINPQVPLSVGPHPKSRFNANELFQLAKNGDAYMTVKDDSATALLGTTHGLPFVGSQSASDFTIRTNNREKMRITKDGNVGIGTTVTGSHKLAVEGSIGARQVQVEASGWSDFVFDEGYNLRSLEEVEGYIAENNHLPEIPGEAEVMEKGIDLGAMDAQLLQKIEELTLYLIEQNKQNQAQQTQIAQLQNELSHLKNNER